MPLWVRLIEVVSVNRDDEVLISTTRWVTTGPITLLAEMLDEELAYEGLTFLNSITRTPANNHDIGLSSGSSNCRIVLHANISSQTRKRLRWDSRELVQDDEPFNIGKAGQLEIKHAPLHELN